MSAIVSLILGSFPWGKLFEFGFMLISKAIKHNEKLKELEQEWLSFTKNINRKIPVKLSSETMLIIAKLEEIERIEKAEIETIKVQNENYRANNSSLYKKNLALEDKLNREEFSGEF